MISKASNRERMLSTHIGNFVDIVAKEWKNEKVPDIRDDAKFKVDLQKE